MEVIERLILDNKKNNFQSKLLNDGVGPFGELQFSISLERWNLRGEITSGNTVEGTLMSGVLGFYGANNLTSPCPQLKKCYYLEKVTHINFRKFKNK